MCKNVSQCFRELESVEEELKRVKNNYEEVKISQRGMERHTKQMQQDLAMANDRLMSLQVWIG